MDLINIPLWKNEKEGRCPSSCTDLSPLQPWTNKMPG